MTILIVVKLALIFVTLVNLPSKIRKCAKISTKIDYKKDLMMPKDLKFLWLSQNSVPALKPSSVSQKLPVLLSSVMNNLLVGLIGCLKVTETSLLLEDLLKDFIMLKENYKISNWKLFQELIFMHHKEFLNQWNSKLKLENSMALLN